MNVQWNVHVHWGCNYQELLALLKNPSSVHLISAYCKWRGLSTKDPSVLNNSSPKQQVFTVHPLVSMRVVPGTGKRRE